MSKKGFAAMDPELQRKISQKGGRMAHEAGTAHEFTSEEASEAGRKGGKATAAKEGHMARIGRRGGRSNARKTR